MITVIIYMLIVTYNLCCFVILGFIHTNKTLKLRPIISSINTYNYNLAQYLCKKLSPHIPNEYSTRDTFTFINTIKEVDSREKFMISFDVSSLFINVPLDETTVESL